MPISGTDVALLWFLLLWPGIISVAFFVIYGRELANHGLFLFKSIFAGYGAWAVFNFLAIALVDIPARYFGIGDEMTSGRWTYFAVLGVAAVVVAAMNRKLVSEMADPNNALERPNED